MLLRARRQLIKCQWNKRSAPIGERAKADKLGNWPRSAKLGNRIAKDGQGILLHWALTRWSLGLLLSWAVGWRATGGFITGLGWGLWGSQILITEDSLRHAAANHIPWSPVR